MNMDTQTFKWEVDTCAYGFELDPRAYAPMKTLMRDNSLYDAQGREIAGFYSPFGAAWGRGSDLMGGPSKEKGAPLPKRLKLTYYDYLYNRFYQLDTELPLARLHALFSQKSVDKDNNYGQVRPRFEILRVGVAPDGYVMLWASGYTDSQVELGSYRAKELTGITPKSYNESLDRGFKLIEDQFEGLRDGRVKAEAWARIQAGWRPDPMHYMRDIRVKYPWKYKLTGAAARIVELISAQGDQQSEGVGAWEMGAYQDSRALRGVPEAAKFWFLDHAGKRHHLWLRFWRRERALSEADLSEVFATFESMFGKYKPEDDFKVLNPEDWGTVEVHVGEDFKTFSATLVRGNKRVPLPVGRTQYFPLNPHAHWPEQATPAPDVVKLFQEGPPK